MATRPYQYHLRNTQAPGADYNAAGLAAKGADGAGITVAVLDDGFQTNHPAFTNLDATLSYDYASGIASPSGNAGDGHGTAVAGVLLGASAWGGPVGIAPAATLEASRINIAVKPVPGSPNALNPPDEDNTAIQAMNQATRTADISNNSWGVDGLGNQTYKDPENQQLVAAIQNAVATGRGGKGLDIVFAAGNSGDKGDDVSFQAIGSDPRVITVGGINADGAPAIDLTHGAGLLVSGPAKSVVTAARYDAATTATDANGLPTGSYAAIDGTSFAAPGVSGIIALMLQANPNLGWRDVQEILVDTAKIPGANAITKPDGTPWFTTLKSGDWNGGGRHFSTAYGYGVPDATQAIELARTWQPTRNSATLATDTVSATPNLAVIGGGAASTTTLTYATSLRIEHVQLTLLAPMLLSANVRLILTAPDGSQSVVADQAGSNQDVATKAAGPSDPIAVLNNDGTTKTNPDGSTVYNTTPLDLTLNDAGFWGVNAQGAWTLSVQDYKTGETGTVQSWGLTFYGDTVPAAAGGATTTPAAAPTTQVYTPEFAAMAAADPTRAVIRPTTNTVIDAADVAGPTLIDLRGGVGMLGGAQVTVQGGTGNVVGGAGNTTLIGIAGASRLTAGDGNTLIVGGAGNTVTGGIGRDTLQGGGGGSLVVSGKAGAVVNLNDTDVLLGSGADTVLGGAGLQTHFALAGGAIAFAGAGGRLRFIGAVSSSTVVGGAGSLTAFGSGKGDIISGGAAGNNVLLTGLGAATLFGGGSGDVLFAQGGGAQVIRAGAGNETLQGGSATTGATYFAGTGNAIIGLGRGNDTVFGATGNATVVGGAGADIYAFTNGRSGGSTTIGNFDPTKGDRITLQGYTPGTAQQAVAAARTTANGYTLTLADNTRISFTTITNLDPTAFI